MMLKSENFGNKFYKFIEYLAESVTPKYSYVLESIHFTYASNKIIVLYRIAGKRGLFDMGANDLFKDEEMLSNFHPLDVKKFAVQY